MDADPFKLFGLAPAFRIAREDVEQAYLARSTGLHPDLSAGNDDAARQMAELNQARSVLANPETRAEALLTRLGGPSASQEKALPDGFLAEMMEVRERVESALSESPDQARRTWDQWSRQEREQAIDAVDKLFDEVSSPRSSRPRLEVLREVRIRLNAWRYIERLIEQLDPGAGPSL